MAGLCAADISKFVLMSAPDQAVASSKLLVTVLRSVLGSAYGHRDWAPMRPVTVRLVTRAVHDFVGRSWLAMGCWVGE